MCSDDLTGDGVAVAGDHHLALGDVDGAGHLDDLAAPLASNVGWLANVRSW